MLNATTGRFIPAMAAACAALMMIAPTPALADDGDTRQPRRASMQDAADDSQANLRGAPGSDCGNTINAGSFPGGPYITENTTCGKDNTYTDTCMGEYDGGEDIFYRFTVTESTCLTIVLTADTIWAGMALFDSCDPKNPDACIAQDTSSANPNFIDIELEPGTYYLMIDTWPAPDCTGFDLIIQSCLTGACCFFDGNCSVETVPDCFNAGGVYAGDAVSCDEVSCFDPAGDDCNDPLVFDLPADLGTTIINDTLGRGNNFSGSCMGSFDGGEDQIIQLNVTEPTCLVAVLFASDNFAGMAIVDDCANPASANCIAQSTSSVNPNVIVTNLSPGTYYLVVDTFPPPDNVLFVLDLLACPFGACCLPDGSCVDATLLDCDTQGSTFQGFEGLLCAEVECPDALVNDTCEGAIEVNAVGRSIGTGFEWTVEGTNIGAQGELSSECATFSGDDPNDVWYKWTSPCNGKADFDVCNANFDTVMTLYDVCPDDLTQWIGCNDDASVLCTSLASEIVDFEVQSGQTYYIRIAGWNGDSGDFELRIRARPPGDVTGDGIVNVQDLLMVISNWGSDGSSGGDANGDGIVNVQDLLLIISNWGASCAE